MDIQNIIIADPLIPPSMAAQILEVKPETLRQWRYRGFPLPFVKCSERVVMYRFWTTVSVALGRRIAKC